MARLGFRPGIAVAGLVLAPVCAVGTPASGAHADTVAYLVNVTMRPGYNFANGDDALAYGHGICDRLGAGSAYGRLMGEVKTHLRTSDEYQASYLIIQAVNELCPALIWRLRNSAAHYQPPGP